MKRKRLLSGCLILVGIFILLLCGVNTAVYWVVPTINQNTWNDLKPENYSLTVNYATFGEMVYTTYHETVTNGVAKRDDPYFSPHDPTIDELFNEIKGHILDPLALLMYSVEYDSIYKFPVRILWNELDLGRITEITDFAPE